MPEIEQVPINISFMNELERFTRGGAGENLRSYKQATPKRRGRLS